MVIQYHQQLFVTCHTYYKIANQDFHEGFFYSTVEGVDGFPIVLLHQYGASGGHQGGDQSALEAPNLGNTVTSYLGAGLCKTS